MGILGAGIWLDLNGNKPPNQFGRDVFGFVYNVNGFIPRGINDYTSCAINKDGRTCAGRVLTEHGIKY